MSRKDTLQVPLRRAAAATLPRLLRDTQESSDKKLEKVMFVVVFCVLLFIFVVFAFISIKMRWKMSLLL